VRVLVREDGRDVAEAALVELVAGALSAPADHVRLGRRCPQCGATDHGRPVVVAPIDGRRVHVSIGRTLGRVAVAVGSSGPLGVDIERVDPERFAGVATVAQHHDETDAGSLHLLAAGWVGTLLGAVALVLSVSGLYGVLTYAISQRRKEIGIRMALGATAGAVVRLVLAQSSRLAGIGALIGGAGTLAVLAMLNSLIHLTAISLVDIGAFGAGLILVFAATVVAAYQPARSATRVDPVETLRADA